MQLRRRQARPLTAVTWHWLVKGYGVVEASVRSLLFDTHHVVVQRLEELALAYA